MSPRTLSVVVGLSVILMAGTPAFGQIRQSHCADCHFAASLTGPAIAHLSEWDRSAHGRHARLEDLAQQAEVPLVEATHAGHAFVFDASRERLDVARERIANIFTLLVNRGTP